MNEAWEEFEQLTSARFSRCNLRLETSLVTVMETEPALTMLGWAVSEIASTTSLSPATWNVETGLKVKVPGPVAEKSYTAETFEEDISSAGVGNVDIGLKAYHRVRQLQSCQRVRLPSHLRRDRLQKQRSTGIFNVNVD